MLSFLCLIGPLFLFIAFLPLMLRAQQLAAQKFARSDHAFVAVRPTITVGGPGLDPPLHAGFLPATTLSPLHVSQPTVESTSLMPLTTEIK